MDPDEDEHIHPGQEDVQLSNIKSCKPTTKGNKLVDQARKMVKHDSVCSNFCGGKKCKYCTVYTWSSEDQAIKGLYSHWITDNILAMARPTNEGIEKYQILDQFLKKGIKTVINLQQPGEHAYCGPGNDKTGFSYNSQQLMEKGMFFYNFGWDDFGVGSVTMLLDIVKVMQFSLSEGKVAVHCHAGLGRTGLLIACYLVFNNRLSPESAVHYIRSKRPGSIQTVHQVQMVTDFEMYIQPFRAIFANNSESEFSLQQHLNRQIKIIHGFEARKLKYIPKIVYICCERLLELANCGNSLNRSQSFTSLQSRRSLSASAAGSQDISRSMETLRVENPQIKTFVCPVKKKKSVTLSHGNSLSDSISEKTSSISSDSQSVESLDSYDQLDLIGGSDGTNCTPECNQVGDALMMCEFPEDILQKVQEYKDKLNSTDEAWKMLGRETDPCVIVAVLWEWLNHLREPILHKQDLKHIKDDADKPLQALLKMDKGTKSVIEYLAKVVVRLDSLPRSKLDNITEIILSHITHQAVHVKTPSMQNKILQQKEHWQAMKGKTAMRIFYFFQKLMESLQESGAITRR
ncbi:protein tyrosine phosphatase domain-containing protein 1 [Patella vulgata]|uniref:protein tyrosine phosphatase domain-containing protein 1 n=1 Tax=Patella vulgata TaxID=6465 RepID=UPI00217F8F88|nr:protein tyrosine phosphatase domain-containing protein 1 [Patella vulgata]